MAKTPPKSRVLRSIQLENEARRLVREGHHELAVIVAQTLLELDTETELIHLMDRIHGKGLSAAIVDLMPTNNVGHPKTRRFFETALGVKLPDEMGAEKWQRFKRHVERRNRVIHGAERITADEANESILAVAQVRRVIRTLVYIDLGEEDILEWEAQIEREELGLVDDDDA
jgi:hypothetical protein